MGLTSLAQQARLKPQAQSKGDRDMDRVSKGMRVKYVNIDGMVSTGKVIGVGWTAAINGVREPLASVLFDDFNETTWFDQMWVCDLLPIDHVFSSCECGNPTRMCHPHA